MTHKASAIDMVWKGGKGETQALKRVLLILGQTGTDDGGAGHPPRNLTGVGPG